MTDIIRERWRMREVKHHPGTWKAEGVTFGPRELELVTKNRHAMVFRRAGYTANWSGIRGLRQDQYLPAELYVVRVLSTEDDGTVVAEPLIHWAPSTVQAIARAAKQKAKRA